MNTRLSVVLAVLIGLLIPASASAHFLGYDSVDGSEIRYEDYTQYDDARIWAINRWNALGEIAIRPDAWNTITDLEFWDWNDCSASWVGIYVGQRPGAEQIYFNICYLKSADTSQRRNVALHELGHALGLAHSFPGQVMNRYITTITTPQSHDRADYYALWR